MSVESISMVLNYSKATGNDRLVLLGIANHDGDGGAWPSRATLGRYANVTPRTVSTCLVRLVELGELVVHRNQGGTGRTDPRHRPNRYEIVLSTGSGPGWKHASTLNGLRVEDSRQQGWKPASTEPSLEPSSIKPVADLDAGEPETARILSLDEYLNAHPDENPRVARWLTDKRADRAGRRRSPRQGDG